MAHRATITLRRHRIICTKDLIEISGLKRFNKNFSRWRSWVYGYQSYDTRYQVPTSMQYLTWNWIFTIKENIVPKARLVIVGSQDQQKYSISETYSPVPSPIAIRWFLSVSLKNNLRIQQLDIKTAFLHSALPYEKFALILDGLSLDRRSYELQLKKAAYGLAISPLLWYNTFAEAILRYGCTRIVRSRTMHFFITRRVQHFCWS